MQLEDMRQVQEAKDNTMGKIQEQIQRLFEVSETILFDNLNGKRVELINVIFFFIIRHIHFRLIFFVLISFFLFVYILC